MNEYQTNYFLVINNKVIKYQENDYTELLKYIADNYDLSIYFYGGITKEEILKCEYMDIHEGELFFIADIYNHNNGKKEPIEIYILDINYLFDYDDVDYGISVINWLKEHSDEFSLEINDEINSEYYEKYKVKKIKEGK